MKIVVVSPAHIGYRWEVDLLTHNLTEQGWCPELVWLTHAEDTATGRADRDAATALAQQHPIITHHHHVDDRARRDYCTSIRPWQISRWLRDDPAARHGHYLYLDSDMLFPSIPDLPTITASVRPDRWIGSQTAEYAGVRALSAGGSGIGELEEIRTKLRLTSADTMRYDNTHPGAQWAICDPDPDMFDLLHTAMEDTYPVLQRQQHYSPWFTDMLVTPWVLRRAGIMADAHPALNFSSLGDDRDTFDRVAIFHDSLTPPDHHKHSTFDKRHWRHDSPVGHSFLVNPTRAVSGYVEALCRYFPSTKIQHIESEIS